MYNRAKILMFLIGIVLVSSCSSKMEKIYNRAKKESKSTKVEDWEKSVKDYDKVIAMKINAAEYQALVYRKLGKYSMKYDHWNDALRYYKLAAKILPNEGVLHSKIGVCYSQLSRSETDETKKMKLIKAAEKEYEVALKLSPKLIDPYYGLGIINFYVYQNYMKGIKYMAKVLSIDPKNIDAHFALGRFYYEIGEPGKALEFYKALLSLVPEKAPRYKRVKENISKIYSQLKSF